MSNDLQINDERLMKLSSDNIDKTIDLLSEIKENRVVEFKKKLKKTKEKIEEVLGESLDLSTFSDDDLQKIVRETKIGAGIKKVTGVINYKIGGLEEAQEKELELNAKVDYEDNFKFSMVLDKIEYTKLDFLHLYHLFSALENSVVKSITDIVESKRKDLIDKEQLDMFPELKNSDLACVEIDSSIYNEKEGALKDIKLRFVGKRDGLVCLEFDKKLWLNKADIFLLYSKFDEIISRIIVN